LKLTTDRHEWMKEGCDLGHCTAILKEEGREEVHQRNGWII